MLSAYLPKKGNIKAYYNLDDVNDGSSNAYNLTNLNSVTFSSAKRGNGANFSSSNSDKLLYVENNLGIDGGAITIAMWVKLLAEISSGEWYFICQYSGSSSDTSYRIYYKIDGSTRTIIFGRTRVNVAGDIITYNVALGTSNWHFIALTYDNTNMRGYLDNSLVAGPTSMSGNGQNLTENTFSIGGYYLNSSTKGGYTSAIIDEVCIWNTCLSPTELLKVSKMVIGTNFSGFSPWMF